MAAVPLFVGCGEEEPEADATVEEPLESDAGVCFNTQNPVAPGSYSADFPIPINVFVDESTLPECTVSLSGECTAGLDGDTLDVEHDLVAEVDEQDCPEPEHLTAECGEVDLEAQTYTVEIGDESYPHEVPAESPRGGPLGPEWSDCVGVGEQRTSDETDDICVAPVDDQQNSTVVVSATHEVGANSCVDDYDLNCGVDEIDDGYEVSSDATYRWVGELGACTADIWGVSTECTEIELEEGTHEFHFEDDLLEVQAPLDEEVCSGS